MPFKHHRERRHRIPRKSYRVVNWSAYEAGLRQRGSITIWLDPSVKEAWTPACRSSRGHSFRYSDEAIEAVHRLRLLFQTPLRMAEGFVTSLFGTLGIALPIPDHTTLSRRGKAFARRVRQKPPPEGPLQIVIDSTGLRVFGQGEWNEAKHGRRKPRRWKKLHLTMDLKDGTVHAHRLTDQSVSDVACGIGMVTELSGGSCHINSDVVSGRHEHACRELQTAPFSARTDRTCGMAVFPVPAELPSGRGNAARTRDHRLV